MTLYLLLAVMCLLAAAFLAMPLLKSAAPNKTLAVAVAVFAVAGSAVLYNTIGAPGIPSGRTPMAADGQGPDIQAMIDSLAARLESEPEDLDGWKMLGRSHMVLQNYAEAASAFEKAVELESAQDATTLVSLAEAKLADDGQSMSMEVVSLFENALALEPNNPPALFYGGIASFNRGNPAQAADRWERLLGTNPPDEIRGVIVQRIAEWRGEPPPAPVAPLAVVSASINLSAAAAAELPDDATVFVIARDPAQPAPPIAVTRRRLTELPAMVELGDRDSMIPGRALSGFAEFELVARVSLSGQPAEQSGDWFGSVVVNPGESRDVSLSIDRQVP